MARAHGWGLLVSVIALPSCVFASVHRPLPAHPGRAWWSLCRATIYGLESISRQKQLLRISGTLVGGVVFGMEAQVFLLTYINSITGFAVLFAAD